MRGAIAIAVVSIAACGSSKHAGPAAPTLPAQRPADLVITLTRNGGVQGGSTQIAIDARGAQVHETTGGWRFDVTDAQRDALWSGVRAAVVYQPGPGAEDRSSPDSQRADVTIDFGGAEYRTEDTGVYGQVLDLYTAARVQRLPETRPADLAVGVIAGGGIHGVGSDLEIAGHDGTFDDTSGKHLTFTVPDAALDTIWGTIRASDPETIATTQITLEPDTQVRIVTVGWAGKSFKFGADRQVAAADAPRVKALDDAITKLAPPP